MDQGTHDTGGHTLDRRRFLRDATIVAWSTPLILTMTANRAGAQSCLPTGSPCNSCTGLDCCNIPGDVPGGCCCSTDDLPCDVGSFCTTDAQCATQGMDCYTSVGTVLSATSNQRSTATAANSLRKKPKKRLS